MSAEDLTSLRFDERGLVPVIAQDDASREVLMLAWADLEALDATLESGFAHYHSRSRGELWRKGATSGNAQRVVDVRYDCDADAVLYLVDQTGPACHTGERSCFHRQARGGTLAAGPKVGIARAMRTLDEVVKERLRDLPEGSYVAKLHDRGVGYVAQKVVEEAGETIVAALQGQHDELRGEAADLLFHLGVLLAESGVAWDEVGETLLSRHRPTEDEPSRT